MWMDGATARCLALGSAPHYNPKPFLGLSPPCSGSGRCRISNEPGSTFKPIQPAIALRKGGQGQRQDYDSGSLE